MKPLHGVRRGVWIVNTPSARKWSTFSSFCPSAVKIVANDGALGGNELRGSRGEMVVHPAIPTTRKPTAQREGAAVHVKNMKHTLSGVCSFTPARTRRASSALALKNNTYRGEKILGRTELRAPQETQTRNKRD